MCGLDLDTVRLSASGELRIELLSRAPSGELPELGSRVVLVVDLGGDPRRQIVCVSCSRKFFW